VPECLGRGHGDLSCPFPGAAIL